MSEGKDPAIKLFGMTIQLPDNPVAAPSQSSECGGEGSPQSPPSEDPPASPNPLSEEDASLSSGRAEQHSGEVRIWVDFIFILSLTSAVGYKYSKEITGRS